MDGNDLFDSLGLAAPASLAKTVTETTSVLVNKTNLFNSNLVLCNP